MSDKKLVYFPSFSAGAYANLVSKDTEILPGVPYRFWDDRTPPEWVHKYFLLTAGHLYKKKTVRADWGLNEATVFGDSGGFQISTGALKWDVNLRDDIFNWLESNADIAANIDIPPSATYRGRFNDALDISIDNFKYFEKKQSGKCRFLNVIQGHNTNQSDLWYDTVKGLDFAGWCFGSSGRLINLMYKLAILIKNGEFNKPTNTWLHFLGITKVTDFLLLAQIQKSLNSYTGNRITVSTDSSSPAQFPIYGMMLMGVNWRTLSFDSLKFPRNLSEFKDKLKPNGKLASFVKHPGVDELLWEYMEDYSTPATYRLTYHNLFVFLKAVDDAVDLIENVPLQMLDTMIPTDFVEILKSVDEMFNSPDPIKVFERYQHYYMIYGGSNKSATDSNVINEFFEL